MNIIQELEKLEKLKQNGVLSDVEFKKAKNKILDEPTKTPTPTPTPTPTQPPAPTNSNYYHHSNHINNDDNSIGKAANKYVNLQIIGFIVGLIIFLLSMCSFNNHSKNFNNSSGLDYYYNRER